MSEIYSTAKDKHNCPNAICIPNLLIFAAPPNTCQSNFHQHQATNLLPGQHFNFFCGGNNICQMKQAVDHLTTKKGNCNLQNRFLISLILSLSLSLFKVRDMFNFTRRKLQLMSIIFFIFIFIFALPIYKL